MCGLVIDKATQSKKEMFHLNALRFLVRFPIPSRFISLVVSQGYWLP